MTAVRLADNGRGTVAAHTGELESLAGWFSRRYPARGYSAADAFQDGWVAIATAARRYDPSIGPFWAYARPWALGAMHDGRRRSRISPVSIEAPGFAASCPADTADTFDQAAARIDLPAAIRAARAAVRDGLDIVVLASMLDLTDDRTRRQLAADHGTDYQLVGQRRSRLRRAALAATATVPAHRHLTAAS